MAMWLMTKLIQKNGGIKNYILGNLTHEMQATSNTFFRFWKGCQIVHHPVVATQSSHTSEWRVQLLYQYFFPTASGREFCWHYNCAVSSYPMCQHGVQFEEHGDPLLSHLSHLNFVSRNGWSITKLNHALYVRNCYTHGA